MPQQINEEVYEEMISALNTFCTNVSDSCSEMSNAATECMDNCEHDEASVKSYSRVNECVQAFEKAVELAEKLAAAMNNELEAAREQARKADNI